MNGEIFRKLLRYIIIFFILLLFTVIGSFVFRDSVFNIVFIGSGLIFLVVSRAINYFHLEKKERCSYTTFARIVVYASSTNSDGVESLYPKYSYQYGGREYTVISQLSNSFKQKPVGTEVEIFLNPDDPEDSYLAHLDTTSIIVMRVFQIVGIILLAAGAATFFIKI